MNLAPRSVAGCVLRFMARWNRDRWELVVLSIPFTRGLLYVTQLAPARLNDEVIPPPWQIILLCLLGAAAAIAGFGVLREMPIVERLGLHIAGPLSVIYALTSIVSAPYGGSVGFVFYMMVAACCFARGREITKSMRIANRMLGAGTRPE